ncbi:MAG TPA: DNA replication and repair protein RecF [Candidatus Sulfotelmatobacter sp.]|nr:DNA replication and repair protein RecF [Candidatus Sulfotelmatobacter sp.]
MIKSLKLVNFRSYENAEFAFKPGINLIVGPNGSGKTNLLEAILVICQGKSYRAKDQDLISFNKSWASLQSLDDKNSKRAIKIEREKSPHKTFRLNGKEYARLSSKNISPVVLFEPEQMHMLSGGPDRRREYFDDLISEIEAGYSTKLRQYKRALAQRNHLLKTVSSVSKEKFFVWNVRLSQLSGQIVKSRNKLIESIKDEVNAKYKDISGSKDIVTLKYQNEWPEETYETSFLKYLEDSLSEDHQKGFTSAGPHREDFVFSINHVHHQKTASRGENRTIVLALKLCEVGLMQKKYERQPIVLLDDVFSEMDQTRQKNLIDCLADCQVIITLTNTIKGRKPLINLHR